MHFGVPRGRRSEIERKGERAEGREVGEGGRGEGKKIKRGVGEGRVRI